jgi:TolB protein
MSCVLDPKQAPWAIDLRSQNGAMLGICSRQGDVLRISLNDEARGRPKDFDKDKNGMVLTLTLYRPKSLCVLNADGSNLKQIVAMPDFTNVASPDWSHDGTRIAFDAWRALYGESIESVQVFTVCADGSELKHVGEGVMPSWSLDDKQLTFSSNGPDRGICIMNADGSDRRLIDPQGWGAQWSPKRNEIAYAAYDDTGANLYIYDVATAKRRALLDKSYGQIFWGMNWSPDGTCICFKGALPGGGFEIAAVAAQGAKEGFKVILPGSALPEVENASSTIAWGGPENRIVLSMRRKGDEGKRLYLFDFTDQRPPELFPGYPTDWGTANTGWSPDGKRIVFSVRPSAKALMTLRRDPLAKGP